MRKMLLISTLILGLILNGCGSQESKDAENKPMNAEVKSQVDEPAKDTEVQPDKTNEVQTNDPDDIWTYYNDATWTDDFNGLVTTIEKVVVSDRAPKDGDPDDLTGSAVGVKMKIQNTTDRLFTTYPNQAELVTSTGEQISASMFYSDNIGGEIDEGVLKEGNVIWFLERGNAESIEWIKMKWNAIDGELFGDNERKEYAIKLQLK